MTLKDHGLGDRWGHSMTLGTFGDPQSPPKSWGYLTALGTPRRFGDLPMTLKDQHDLGEPWGHAMALGTPLGHPMVLGNLWGRLGILKVLQGLGDTLWPWGPQEHLGTFR